MCGVSFGGGRLFAPGIGPRLDGWGNKDLNVGAIAALAPNLQPVADLLGVDVETLKKVLNSWGPGKFDAEVFLDGKAFRPDGGSAATLNPNAYGLVGFNQHTWTGGWGTVTYWNAFVANLELHGKGNFFDPRLDNAEKFPVAAKAGLGHVTTPPDQDQVTSKLGALQFYQLALPAPKPPADVFNSGGCPTAGNKSLTPKPSVRLVISRRSLPNRVGISTLQKKSGLTTFKQNAHPMGNTRPKRSAACRFRQLGVFMKPENKGRFYHDGRFATLRDVVNHYNTFLNLGLTEEEVNDLINYLKSL